MKKAKILFSILLVCTIVLTGCGKKDNKNKENNNNNNNSNEAELVGDSLDIKLETNSSTGYSWTYDLAGDDIVILSNTYEEGKNCEGLDGCAGYEIYTVTALKPGNITLTLTYANINNEILYENKYDITIDKDLKIQETHSGSYFEK